MAWAYSYGEPACEHGDSVQVHSEEQWRDDLGVGPESGDHHPVERDVHRERHLALNKVGM